MVYWIKRNIVPWKYLHQIKHSCKMRLPEFCMNLHAGCYSSPPNLLVKGHCVFKVNPFLTSYKYIHYHSDLMAAIPSHHSFWLKNLKKYFRSVTLFNYSNAFRMALPLWCICSFCTLTCLTTISASVVSSASRLCNRVLSWKQIYSLLVSYNLKSEHISRAAWRYY